MNNFRKEQAKHEEQKKLKRPWRITRVINGWFNRLLGAASDGSFSNQEELYAANRTSRDYLWNTIGHASWGMMFPLLTIVVTQLVGVEQAGMFSMAFVVGLLLMFIANYGVRTYQVSDLDESYSFSDYQVNRLITCAAMLFVGLVYCVIRGYSEEMFAISMGVYVYKMIDGLADVYEGRLQQVGKLYLAGISQTIRSLLVFVVFSVCLLVTHSLVASCIAMAVTAVVSFLIVSLPLAFLETQKSKKLDLNRVKNLLVQCFPLFLALFLFNLVDSMPKFVMEGVLSYDNQLYFNALYFPAQAILIVIQLIYKPQLVRMAYLWSDPNKHKKFDLMIVIILAIIALLTLGMILIMGSIGLPIMSFLYGIDFMEFRSLCFIMLIAGGVTAGIDFLYQAITVLRKQKSVIKLYLLTFVFALFIPALLVNFTGLPGSVISYLIIMSILFLLLVVEFVGMRYAALKESLEESRKEKRRRLTPEERAKRKEIKERREAREEKRAKKLRAEEEKKAKERRAAEELKKTKKRQ